MTWALHTKEGRALDWSVGNDAGDCMLHIMEYMPEVMGFDYLEWLRSRDSRARQAVFALFNQKAAADMKEEYLRYVNHYAEIMGHYITYRTELELKEVTEDGES